VEEFMSNDRAKHTVLPISKFGLMQITRQRLRPELKISTSEVCPTCSGTGKIGPSILISDEIEKDFKYLINQGHRSLELHVHPILEAYLTKGRFFNSIVWKWYWKFKAKVKIVSDANSPITHYHFIDRKTEEMIKL
jgi:ribonuclease G